MAANTVKTQKQKAIMLIVLFGIISLFGDIIYEGARGVYGPFTKTLGMDIALVGLVTGIAEFLGYFIRLFSGFFADKTKAHWIFTIIGYGMLVSIPLLSLSGFWPVVILFIICERLGKAIRSPAKDTILSQAAKQVGTGWGFALHEAMDQIGAIAGPLIFTGLFLTGSTENKGPADYQFGFSLLWIPFGIVMISVLVGFFKVPNPEKLETPAVSGQLPDKLTKIFWLYTLFSFITTLGFVSFVILGYHFKEKQILTDAQIPLFYAIAMGIDGAAALVIGKVYDKLKKKARNENAGLTALIVIPLFTLLIPIFGFIANFTFAVISVILWGIVMGTHETIMKSAIADLTHFKKRGSGYGIFNTAYGLALFAGSSLIGLLYKVNLVFAIALIIITQLAALVLYFILYKEAVLPQKAAGTQ